MTQGADQVPAVTEIRAQALEVAAGWSPPDAPDSWRLTAALFEAIAAHDGLLNRLAALPPSRLPALLASAAVSFLVGRDRPVPLAGYFPGPGAPQPPFDAAFFPAARGFFTGRLDDIAALCHQHRYQMNEVARCSQIALGIAATAGSPTDPVALADLGTGAGLGLQLDRYRYHVGPQAAGPPAAALSLGCEVRGPRQPPPLRLPPIAERAGIDVHPIDVQDAAARSWLRACAPPEATALTRLAAAMEVARQHPVRLVAGEVTEALAGVLDRFPPQTRHHRGRCLPERVPAARAARAAGPHHGRRGHVPPGHLAVAESPRPARACRKPQRARPPAARVPDP